MPTLLSINNYNYRRGGAEVVFLEQNRLFEDIDWQVIPFAMQHSKNIDSPWDSYFIDEIEFGQNYSILEKIARFPKVIYSFEARKKLKQLLRVVHPDICHAHNVYHHISPSIFSLLNRQGIPVVLTLHDLKLACPAYKMLTHDGICERCKQGKLYNVMIHKCIKGSSALSAIIFMESMLHRILGSYINNVDRFVVPSRFYLNKMVEWGFERKRFIYIPNFVEVDDSLPARTAGRAFLFFGRLAPEKGLVTLVKAAVLAKVPLWIVGSGPEEEHLKQLSVEMNANIQFFGYMAGEALREKIRSARAVVLPSEWYENAPISMMEAYALGVPVIGAAIGGIEELIETQETGITFQSGSVEELARVLRWMADLPDARVLEMGQAGRSWMNAEFTAEHYRERLRNLYADLGVTD